MYVPAASALNVLDVCQVIPPSIEYWYGAVAPDTLRLIDPLLPPWQEGSVNDVEILTWLGSVMVIFILSLQLLLSFISIV